MSSGLSIPFLRDRSINIYTHPERLRGEFDATLLGRYKSLTVNGKDLPMDPGTAHTFRTTHWSVVLAAGEQRTAQGQKALARLCQIYWLPVYAFVRKRGYPPDQSKDLTQDFFEKFLEKNSVARAVRERGRFRSFLMTAVENFLHKAHERSQAQKRGGGQPHVSLQALEPEQAYRVELAGGASDPIREFEVRWALTVLDRVAQRLREEFHETGRQDLFDALEAHLWGDVDSVPYAELAGRFGISEANIKTTALRCRRRYQLLLRDEIAQTVSQPGEIDEEIRYLMRLFSS
jgi:RNA polymerase sigma factor (sigma-70 family)